MMKLRKRFKGVAILFALTLVLAACGGDDDGGDSGDTSTETETEGGETDEGSADAPDTLTIAAVPAEATEDLGVSWGPFTDALSEELGGIEIETFEASDYGAVVEAMIAGNIDLAFFGAFAYYIAKEQGADVEALAANIITEDGMLGYHSYGITQPDNDEIESIEDFEGKSVCFVDPGSTSGGLFPAAGLIGAGIDPEEDVNAIYAGAHDTSLLSVVNGDCEAGFFHEFTLIDIDAGRFTEATRDDFKIVYESPLIPAPPMVAGPNLSADFKGQLADAISKLDAWYLAENGYCDDYPDLLEEDSEGQPVCLIRDTYGYEKVEAEFYDPIWEVCERTQANACQTEG